MANSVKLEIMTPSKLFYRGDVELLIVRTLEGDEGFMAGHTWACKLLDIGELYIQEAGAEKEQYKVAAVSGGLGHFCKLV
jgi:F-type H+-transporting ATPase subunit epsilon